MIFIALAKNDIETADQIIRNSEFTSEQLNALKDRFSPLTAEELSWFRPVLAEYANAQYILDVTMQGELIEEMHEEESLSKKRPSTTSLMFKPNQTLQFFKALYEPILEAGIRGEDMEQAILNADMKIEKKSSGLRVFNPWNGAGRMLMTLIPPSLSKAYTRGQQTQIKSDLLTLEIHKRLGESLDLKDPYTGAAYQFDEPHQQFYCIGPDSIAGTDDDIYINAPSQK
jgi:hypothetical protein